MKRSVFLVLFITAFMTVTMTSCKDDGFKRIPVTGVSLDKTQLSLVVGGTTKLIPKVEPSGAYCEVVKWTSSNTSVAEVNMYGTVTAKAAGSATVTVITVDGDFTATCAVTVSPAP